jgi:hypothetical protein
MTSLTTLKNTFIGKIDANSKSITVEDYVNYKKSGYIGRFFMRITLSLYGKGPVRQINSQGLDALLQNNHMACKKIINDAAQICSDCTAEQQTLQSNYPLLLKKEENPKKLQEVECRREQVTEDIKIATVIKDVLSIQAQIQFNKVRGKLRHLDDVELKDLRSHTKLEQLFADFITIKPNTSNKFAVEVIKKIDDIKKSFIVETVERGGNKINSIKGSEFTLNENQNDTIKDAFIDYLAESILENATDDQSARTGIRSILALIQSPGLSKESLKLEIQNLPLQEISETKNLKEAFTKFSKEFYNAVSGKTLENGSYFYVSPNQSISTEYKEYFTVNGQFNFDENKNLHHEYIKKMFIEYLESEKITGHLIIKNKCDFIDNHNLKKISESRDFEEDFIQFSKEFYEQLTSGVSRQRDSYFAKYRSLTPSNKNSEDYANNAARYQGYFNVEGKLNFDGILPEKETELKNLFIDYLKYVKKDV